MKNNEIAFRETNQNGTKSQGGSGTPQKINHKKTLKIPTNQPNPTKKTKHVVVPLKMLQDTSENGR